MLAQYVCVPRFHVSLLPALGKILDRILAVRLSHLMKQSGKLSDEQYGFRNGRETTSAVAGLVTGVLQNTENGRHSLVVSLDLSNTFGTAWGPWIIDVMRKKEVGNDYEKIIKSFLTEREIEAGGLEWAMEVGCPQGSSLGPILWLIIMEDWFGEMRKHEREGVRVQAYADDQVIKVSGTSVRKVEKVWEEVWVNCRLWTERNRLKYNERKTVAMFVSGGRKVRIPVVRMRDIRVEISTSMKYLGIVIDNKMKWIDHVKHVRSKVQNIGGKFMGVARRKWGRKRNVLKIIYERAVCAMILYGVGVWGIRGNDLKAITGAYGTALQRHLL